MKIRKGQPQTKLTKELFIETFRRNFHDPHFEAVEEQIQAVAEVAWSNYEESRKAPITMKAGKGFEDPNYDLSVEWYGTHRKLIQAEIEQRTANRHRVLLINASPRNEHTCPGEIPKSYRLAERAAEALKEYGDIEVDFLDLSLLTVEYGKKIYPCKSCVSTAMPLCHWPCSCYPNHSLNQTKDWMAEIYERWVRAHGVFIITPVHWYQVPSGLKLMMDRLVCADGGNPDPTSTHGKTALEAKRLELKGWDYPKHLKNRAFAIYVHGDYAGAQGVRQSLDEWLQDMDLIPADYSGHKDRYIGYMKPYATSHDELDQDKDVFREIDNMALALMQKIEEVRRIPELTQAKEQIIDPRPK